MTTTTESIFTKTDKEYAEIDTATAKARKMFAKLKDMEANGMKGTAEWNDMFEKYAVTFKKAHGYRPHWVR